MNRIEKLRSYIDDVLLKMEDYGERRCGYLHLYGVSAFAALLASKRGEDVELATIAGMLHDLHTYQTLDSRNHAVLGGRLAESILNELKITSDLEREKICEAIACHSRKLEKHSPFVEVLIDADVLQHTLYNVTLPISGHEVDRVKALKKELGLLFDLTIKDKQEVPISNEENQ